MAYKKISGEEAYIEALRGTDLERLEELHRKEASRQVGVMLKWKEYQEVMDPVGMADMWAEEEDSDGFPQLFPMIEQAVKYRYKLYNLNKQWAKLEFEIKSAKFDGHNTKAKQLQKDFAKVEDERIALCWRIRKIFMWVKFKAAEEHAPLEGEELLNEVQDYEYDAEKS